MSETIRSIVSLSVENSVRGNVTTRTIRVICRAVGNPVTSSVHAAIGVRVANSIQNSVWDIIGNSARYCVAGQKSK